MEQEYSCRTELTKDQSKLHWGNMEVSKNAYERVVAFMCLVKLPKIKTLSMIPSC